MKTLKTAFVVVGLLAVLYGAYVVINKPQSLPFQFPGQAKEQAREGEPSPFEISGPEAKQLAFDRHDAAAPVPGMPSHASASPAGGGFPSPAGFSAGEAAPGGSFSPGMQPPPLAEAPPSTYAQPNYGTPGAPSPETASPAASPYSQQPYPSTTSFGAPGPTEPAPYGYPGTDSTPTTAYAPPAAEPPPGASYRDIASAAPVAPPPTSHGIAPARDGLAFAAAWRSAEEQLGRGHLGEALRTLTPFHTSGDLTPDDRTRLMDLLDRLAGTVIYSKQHHFLAPPTRALGAQRLTEIADQHKLPWQLLAQINNVQDPNILFPGEELKVLPGPFDAAIRLEARELTLTVAGCYAGRFPLVVGTNPPPRFGVFNVNRKLPPGDPANPLQAHVIDLGGGLTIYGDSGIGPGHGSIVLSPRDAMDVAFILTERKSAVTIER